MNVFVLCAQRSASMTFAAACRHATNFTSGHETLGLSAPLGPGRFAYPDNHIEVDNRLAWLLGRLDLHFGQDAYYVHWERDIHDTARSCLRRMGIGIMNAYERGVLQRYAGTKQNPISVCYDYLYTVEANIKLFLRDKPHCMQMHLDEVQEQFRKFWRWIGAKGDLSKALKEFSIRYNRGEGIS